MESPIVTDFKKDKIGEFYQQLKKGEFKPSFLKNLDKVEVPLPSAVMAALMEVKRNLELALIRRAFPKNHGFNRIEIMQLIRDLNYVHSYIWKVEQDVKNGKT